MTPESPMRAQANSRITDADSAQASLFDSENYHVARENSLLNDYRQRYGLSEDPFSDDPSFPLFTAAGRRQLLDQLLHLCQFSNHLLVITGEQGVGKTRIAHALADSLEENDQLCFLALSPGQTLEQLLVAVAESFNLEIPPIISVDLVLAEIEKFINSHDVDQDPESEEGLILLIIDNAENLDSQAIAVLGSLLETKSQTNPLHLVLVGEPRLISRLNNLESETLQISDFHLPAFSLAETVDYLNFRMEMADYLGPEIFTDSVVDPWWRQAHGQLNVIHECAQDKLLQSVTRQEEPRRSGLPLFHILAISAVIAVAGVFYLYLDDKTPQKNTSAVVSASSKVEGSVASSIAAVNLTETPVQPILPSLTTVSPKVEPEDQVQTLAQSSVANESTKQNVAASSVSELDLPKPQTPTEIASTKVERTIERQPTSAADLSRLAAPNPRVDSTSYTANETQILSWPAKEFTIQLLGVSNFKSAQEFVSAQVNKADLFIFKTKRAGKDWYVVIAGHYPSNAAARSAIASLPSKQRDAGPWPRQINVIQQEIRK